MVPVVRRLGGDCNSETCVGNDTSVKTFVSVRFLERCWRYYYFIIQLLSPLLFQKLSRENPHCILCQFCNIFNSTSGTDSNYKALTTLNKQLHQLVL